jgi:hypothetical protein
MPCDFRRLSNLRIDANKDWKDKTISNVDLTIGDGLDIELEETLGADHTATGIVVDGITAGENVDFPDLCYFKSDSKSWKAQADAAATTDGELLIALEAILADATGKFLKIGYLRDDSWAFTVAAKLYVDDTTAGDITETRPGDVGDQVRIVGYAHTATIAWFLPDSTIIQL